MSLPICRRGGP